MTIIISQKISKEMTDVKESPKKYYPDAENDKFVYDRIFDRYVTKVALDNIDRYPEAAKELNDWARTQTDKINNWFIEDGMNSMSDKDFMDYVQEKKEDICTDLIKDTFDPRCPYLQAFVNECARTVISQDQDFAGFQEKCLYPFCRELSYITYDSPEKVLIKEQMSGKHILIHSLKSTLDLLARSIIYDGKNLNYYTDVLNNQLGYHCRANNMDELYDYIIDAAASKHKSSLYSLKDMLVKDTSKKDYHFSDELNKKFEKLEKHTVLFEKIYRFAYASGELVLKNDPEYICDNWSKTADDFTAEAEFFTLTENIPYLLHWKDKPSVDKNGHFISGPEWVELIQK